MFSRAMLFSLFPRNLNSLKKFIGSSVLGENKENNSALMSVVNLLLFVLVQKPVSMSRFV